MTIPGVPRIGRWGVLIVAAPLLLAPVATRAADGLVPPCRCTGDDNGDGTVTVDELVVGVNNALDGCPLCWQQGCGPPIGGGSDDCPTGDVCTAEKQLGEPCEQAAAECCPPNTKCLGQQCNEPRVCATHAPFACPISRRVYKRDIRYLAPVDLQNLRNQLLAFKLARYRYRSEGPSGPEHLGFIIDDVEPSPAVVDARGDGVDLYGYLSMAVATLQAQANDLAALKREVADLQERLNESHSAPSHSVNIE